LQNLRQTLKVEIILSMYQLFPAINFEQMRS